MLTVPVIPDSAPFSAEQRAWLNGFLAGLFSRGQMNPALAGVSDPGPASRPAQALTPLTILFGSQTGTAENLARRAAREAGKRGFAPMVLDMAQTDAAKLASEKNLLVIVSTYGDGEPPDSARALHAALTEKCPLLDDTSSAPGATLHGIRFSVCALGDTHYAQFCQCGKDFDALLAKLGATRAVPRADCDLEYETTFAAWLDQALRAFGAARFEVADGRSETRAAIAPTPSPARPALGSAPDGFTRSRPFPALLLVSPTLCAVGSAKQVHHIEFDLGDSGLAYQAGDALGVCAHNCPALVGEILGALGCDGEEAVPAPDGSGVTLRRALIEFYDLGRPTADLLAVLAPAAAGRAAEPAPPFAGHHVLDVLLARREVKLAPVDFVRTLRKLQPRLYSISSSPRAHPRQVHLTVGAVRYEFAGRARKGVCSTFLADRVVPSESRVDIFVHSNKTFRPPANPDAPMIMIGPGTGIAPFRAFLQERRATGARGKNWLFFGGQHAATDFLYREELPALQSEGTLSRLDLAWSRDQAEKIYVQHRMLEHAAELQAWLDAGAHLYVCGDASRMAKDVDAALHKVVERAGGKAARDAAAYVQALRASGRYARDVY